MVDTAAPAGSKPLEAIDLPVLKVAGVVVLGAVMSIIDTTVVDVALPTFQKVFARGGVAVRYSTVAWTVTAYTLALATVIPLTGWAAQRYGTKRLYMAAIALFTVGSALCATASSIQMLIGFRALQGIGGGVLIPLGTTILTKAAGPQRMGRLMAVLGVPMLLGPIGGPILGGWLIEDFSWHWIFLVNVPIGVVAIGYAALALPRDQGEPSESFDWMGMVLMSPGLVALLYGVSSIPGEGTVMSGKVGVPVGIGLVMLAGFAWHSFRPEHPLLDLRLFRNRDLSASTVTLLVFAAALFGGILLMPTYFQQVRGESTLHSGLLMAPIGLGSMITMPIAGNLADRFPVGRIVPFGIITVMGGMLSLTQLTATSSYWGHTIPTLFVTGLGMGATMMPIMTAGMKTLAEAQVSRGSTILNITQQISASTGVAVISVVLTNQLKDHVGGSPAAGFANTFWVPVGLVLAALVPALFLRRTRLEAFESAPMDLAVSASSTRSDELAANS